MQHPSDPLTEQEANSLAARAATVFTPRSPVSTQELFAGRWDQIQSLVGAVAEIGLHVVIYGERGVGKTSLANIIQPLLRVLDEDSVPPRTARIVVKVNANTNDTFATLWCKALDEIRWSEDKPMAGFVADPVRQLVTLRQKLDLEDDISIDSVRRTLSVLTGSVFVFDEFDRLASKWTSSFTDLIKSLADHSISATVVLVGVAETVDELIRDHASIPRALIQIHMPRMPMSELLEILRKAEEKLGVGFLEQASSQIGRMSQGLPHYVHLIGLSSIRAACEERTRTVTSVYVQQGFERALRDSDHTMAKTYDDAKHSAHKALFEQVLVAAALAASASNDPQGYFKAADVVEPLRLILKRAVDISMFNSHLQEFVKEDRGKVLERSGKPRAYRYRFRDPLVLPYVLLRGVSAQLITPEQVAAAERR